MTRKAKPGDPAKPPGAKPKRKRTPRAQADPDLVARRSIVRRALCENTPHSEIVRLLVAGVQVTGGKVYRVSAATARADVRAVEAEFRGLFTSQDAADLEIAKCHAQLTEISGAAMSGARPQYHAAIVAIDRRIKIAAPMSSRWKHLAGNVPDAPAAGGPEEGVDAEALARVSERAAELDKMTKAELLEYQRKLTGRMSALGLELIPGGAEPRKVG